MDILLPLVFAFLILYAGIRLLARLFEMRDVNQKFDDIIRNLKGRK